MPVLLIDAVSAVQEVVLQAGEQVFGKVRLGFAGVAMLMYLPELFTDNRFVASIRKVDGAFPEPARWPTDRVDEPTPMGMIVSVARAAIVLPGDLTQERIDDFFGHCRATMYFFCRHCFGLLLAELW